MELPSDLKELYLTWIQELIDSLNKNQEQLQLTYEKAKKNLSESEGPFLLPKSLTKVKGIGDTIAKRLEKKLILYCKQNDFQIPGQTAEVDGSNSTLNNATTVVRTRTLDTESRSEQPLKKRRQYIPKKRSGGYAILLALLEANATNVGLDKNEVIKLAQKFCNHSLSPNYATKSVHSAWSSVNSLIKNMLVMDIGRPKRYFITENGLELARTLKATDGINFDSDTKISTEDSSNKQRWNRDDEKTANFSSLFPSFPKAKSQFSAEKSVLDVTFNNEESPSIRKKIINGTTEIASVANSTPMSNSHAFHLTDENLSVATWKDNDIVLKRRFNTMSYEVWNQASYDIVLLIDHREIKSRSDREFFTNAFEMLGIKSEIRQLSLGDMIWVAKHRTTGYECVLNTIIERKRLDDLAGSIRDNRFMEQKMRLDKSGCEHKVYLIEEAMGNSVSSMAGALTTALWLILIYYRFSMIRSNNTDETVEKVSALHKVIQKSYTSKTLIVLFSNDIKSPDDYNSKLLMFKEEFEKTNKVECCHTYECFQSTMSKNNLRTIAELTINTLMYIKGISLEKAISIQSVFPTINHILKAYRACKTTEEAKLLIYNKLGTAPGSKKITRNLSQKISEVFYSK